MPYSQLWQLQSGNPQPPLLPTVAGSGQPSNAVHYDQTHYLGVLQKSYPSDYFQSIKRAQNGGYEMFIANAVVAERVSLAISRMIEDGILMFASGGRYATGRVDFYRTDYSNGAVTYLPGTLLQASKTGRLFQLTTNVVFGATDTGPVTGSIQSIACGYEYNLPGEFVSSGGEVLPGEIDTIWMANSVEQILTPPTPMVPSFDPNMMIRQILPTANGRPASLDGIGEDRGGLKRQAQETDDVYRQRIIDLPDTVSPDAIVRGVNKILYAYGIAGCCLREVGTSRLPGFFCDYDACDIDPVLTPEDRFVGLSS